MDGWIGGWIDGQMDKDNESWQGCGEKETRVHCWQECMYGAAIMESSMEFIPQKTKQNQRVIPSVPLLGIHWKKIKVPCQ